MTDPIAPADPDVVLRAQNVDLVRDGKLILDRISVTIRAGEHWALLGPNGAGKSTLLNIMATYAHPTRGQMDILGHRLGRVNVFSLRPWIGHITPSHRVEPARTARDVVLTGITGTIELPQYWVPGTAELSRAEDLIDLMGLKGRSGSRWRTLSQGERGRTLIARALMAEPRLLLLDEPAAGLDVAGREQLLASIDELRERRPTLATVLVTHHLEELPASTSHAILLRAGQLLGSGPVADVLTTELVSACFDYPVAIARHAGRWASIAGTVW